MGRHARRRRSSGVLALGVVVTVLAGGVAANAESWWPPSGPFVTSADPGQRVEVEPVWVTVHELRTAVTLDGGLDQLETAGAWVAVDVTAEAMTAPSSIAELALRDADGREFVATERYDNPMVGSEFQPGLPERGEVVFEVPLDAVGELTLVVSPDAPGRRVPRATAEIELDAEPPADDDVIEPAGRAVTLEASAETSVGTSVGTS